MGQGTPWWVLVEILGRIVLIYLLLMVTMRLMGKRVAAQMSLSEIAVVITLGAAVGVPMQAPERGLLAPLVILIVAIVFQRGLSFWAFRSRRAEVVSQGDLSTLLEDGRLLIGQLKVNTLSRERLFAMLRSEGVQHLGQLRRVYLESSGELSVVRRHKPRPGLSVLPSHEEKAFDLGEPVPDTYVCNRCGNPREAKTKPTEPCERCDDHVWTEAVLEAKD